MISPAFRKAEWARRKGKLAGVSKPQRRTLASLSRKAGIEEPEVRTKAEATKALTGLEKLLSLPPQLEGFSASTRGEKG